MIVIDKLIRDKIPDLLDEKKVSYEIKKVNSDEEKDYVRRKIQEEVDELLDSEDICEVWDILEILRKFCEIKWYNWQDVEKERLKKLEERGWFEKWIILTKLWK